MATAYINFQGLFRVLRSSVVVNNYGERIKGYSDAFVGHPILTTLPPYALADNSTVAMAADDYYRGLYGTTTYATTIPIAGTSAMWFRGNVQPSVVVPAMRFGVHDEDSTHAIYTRWGIPIKPDDVIITYDPVLGNDQYVVTSALVFPRSTQCQLKRSAVLWPLSQSV